MPVKPIPEGYHSVTPYLVVRGAAKALDFYKTSVRRDGTIPHAGTGRHDHACRDQDWRLADHARR